MPPIERFRLAGAKPGPAESVEPEPPDLGAPVTTRRVSTKGTISFAAAQYRAGAWLAGPEVEVICASGLVLLHHRGGLIATPARRHPLNKQDAGMRLGRRLPQRRWQ